MREQSHNPAARYQKIKDACKTTGLSQYFLRSGCKAGTIPHVRSGRTYFIDVPAMIERLGSTQERRDA